LFQRARAGSERDLEAFYERSARKLLPWIRLRMGRALRAEMESRDILQAVLIKSLDRLEQVQDPSAAMAWLARIAENEIRDRVDYHGRQRRDAARRVPLDSHADLVPAPVRQALSQAIVTEETERLERALEALPDAQREIIVLRMFEELTFRDIGARLGRSEDACRMAFARAMAALTLQMAGRP
jgi:RNA polymerase sigma-70 factor (ECF subfamily)